jgi:leucyl-tRNA synthetase
MIYPILPLLAEEAWLFAPKVLKKENAVYKMGWFEPKSEWYRSDLGKEKEQLDILKENVFQMLESARAQK